MKGTILIAAGLALGAHVADVLAVRDFAADQQQGYSLQDRAAMDALLERVNQTARPVKLWKRDPVAEFGVRERERCGEDFACLIAWAERAGIPAGQKM